ncbi:unnamed protein product [Mytilus edulis]|uniref:Endonuclease/exonuclease/phosphatase domain-containing protein n=1 Tax=Mytilus edulis TaxID=6550 RepID=A0A8S3T5T5_MYTED|nr:unnamed protein product [Mytilus edulis]
MLTFVILLLIMLSNDVEVNPGPLGGFFSIFHLNIRSMRNKVDYVENISNEADVICLTETHLDENIKNEDILIEGYNRDPYRKDRNSSGGGIIIYISKFIQAKPRPDLDFDNEALWLEITFPSNKLLLCVVYRQPSNNNTFWDKFHESIENAMSYTPNVVITGDVNVDFLTDHSHKIFDIMRLNGLKNVINEPTRFCATRQSLLDPILVSDSCDVYDSHVIQIDRTYSDHDGTIIFLNNLGRLQNNTTYKRMIWDYRNADFDKCNELIATFDWESIINAENSRPPPCCACVRAPCNCPPCSPPWPTYKPRRRYPHYG